MRAAVHHSFGAPDVLHIEAVEAPALAAGQIRIAVHASAVTRGDLRLRAADFPGIGWLPGRLMFGFRRPRYPVGGSTFAGRVIEVGAGVSRFAVGDDVFGGCGAGAYAETLVVNADGAVAPMPAGSAYADVAAAPYGLNTAVTFLEDLGRVQPGERVLIVGAGGVGRYAVQLARHLGADVTAVCSARDAERVRALGAHHVIDYAAEDFAAGDRRYDVVFDTADTSSFARSKRVLDPGGRFLSLHLGVIILAQTLWTRLFGRRKAIFGMALGGRVGMQRVAALIASGAIAPAVARRLPFERIAEAHAAAEAGGVGGDVIVEFQPGASLRLAA